MKILQILFLAFLLSFLGGAVYQVWEYYPESLDHPWQFLINSLAAAPAGIGCPAGWYCIKPANNTTTDEFNMTSALANRSSIMLLPGTFALCKQFSISNGQDIAGITWHNDDSISAAANAALAKTVWTCNDGTFSRFSANQAFINSTNTQNWSIQNIQFYGAFVQNGLTVGVNCVNSNTTTGGVSGGYVIAHNSMIGCSRGIALDQSAGGNTQDGQIDDNNIGDNYLAGIYCFGCSDFRMHGDHFGTNGASGRGNDVQFINATTNQINNSRFEFADLSILVQGSTRIGITGNHFDQVNQAINIVGSAANTTQDVQITGNTGVLSFTNAGSTMLAFADGGGANTANKIGGIVSVGNSWASACTNCSIYAGGSGGYSVLSWVFDDAIDGQKYDTFYSNAVTTRQLLIIDKTSPQFVTENSRLVMYNATKTGMTVDNLVTVAGFSNGEEFGEDTSNGVHNIAEIAGFTTVFSAAGDQWTFDALLAPGAVSRNFRFYWTDPVGVNTNAIGVIFNPSTCTYVGTSGQAGTGAAIGTPTAVSTGGACHVRATLTLGAVASNPTYEYDIVSAPTTLSYTGTTGSFKIYRPTFKLCDQPTGTAC